MCSTTRIIWCFTFLNFLVFVQCAPEFPAEDSYGIISTESAIRNTVNNLFSTLKLKVIQNKLKLKQYSRIHNFFVSITLRNHNNLKKIAKLTEADNTDNGTQVFITQLNEVLNEDNKSDEEKDSVYVTFLIEDFINRLDQLKDRHDLKNNTKNFDLNKAIIRYFNKKEFGNTTYLKEEFAKRNDSNDSVLSDNEFWQPSGRRIFQGVDSKIKFYPFMASIKFFGKFQCGGSIINPDLIITSASCLQIAWNNRFYRENPSFLSVQVGSTFHDHGGESIPVMEIYFHPSFDPKTLRHNLAIMRLTRMLAFRKIKHGRVKKIGIDSHPWPLPSNVDGVVIVGWGVKTFGGTVVTAQKLSVATLGFYPLEECQEIYSKDFVTDRNFCAGFLSKGGGACNHDAGGPGVVGGILTGVISFGAPVCGTRDAPTVFTKLGYYTDWIEEIMEMKLPTGRQQTTLKPVNHPTFRLPSVTVKTTMKIRPFVNGKQYNKPSKPDIARTNDEIHEFREFLKTFFEETLEEETEEATESSYESEETDSSHTTQKVKEIHKFKVKSMLRNKPNTKKETKKEIKTSSNQLKKKTERKEKNKWSIGSQSQSKDDSEDKTTSIRPSTIFGSEKYTLLSSEYDVSFAEAPNSSTSLDTEFDEAIESLIDTLNVDFQSKGSSMKKDVESNPDLTDRKKHKGKKRKETRIKVKLEKKNKHKSNSNKRGLREHNKKKADSSEDEQDEENSSNENEQSQRKKTRIKVKLEKNKHKSYSNKRGLREHHNKKDDSSEDERDVENGSNEYKHENEQSQRKKTMIKVKLKKNKQKSDSNKRVPREHYNIKDDSSEDERDEENGSNEYKNENEQSHSNPKPDTKAYMKSDSTDTQKNEDSEEVVHTVHKNNKNKRYKTGDKDKKSDEDQTDKEYKTTSILSESSEQENSSSNNTDRLIDMLEYEDFYKLLSGHGIDK